MRVVYMGTPEFAVPALEALLASEYEVVLVVTQPDRRGNRGKMTYSPVKETALAQDIPVAQPVRIRTDEDFLQSMESLAPDMIVVAAFGQILPKRLLDIPQYGCINIHGSLLPKLRGAAPMQYSILEGHEKTGVTLMRMDEGLDTGDMIAKAELPIEKKNIEELGEELAARGAELLMDTIPSILDGTAVYTPQEEGESTYASRIDKKDGLTDFHRSAEEEERRIRAFYGWPNAYSYYGERMVKFYAAEVLPEAADGAPGTVKRVGKKELLINCGEGTLRILELQLQGKKRLAAADFLRGCPLAAGDRFTAEPSPGL